MTELTAEQKREFWEWCGFKYLGRAINYNYAPGAEIEQDLWEWPSGSKSFALPSLTGVEALDNLFKYAVPQVRGTFILADLLVGWVLRIVYHKEGPALALFYALDKYRKEGER